MKKLVHFSFLIFLCSICPIYNYEDFEDGFNLLSNIKTVRVDKDVKRPVRFCQGFEDPAEIDCYIRSDIKPYVCTEPASFNPCESLQRVETFHYDHITHRCYKLNLPACEGQLIRVMTLLQCLIYCHTKDPFALGKSRSMVFKLNQEKPYVPHEKVKNEKDIILKIRDGDEINSKALLTEVETKQNPTVNQKSTTLKNAAEKSVIKSKKSTNSNSVAAVKKVEDSHSMNMENTNEDSFIKALDEDDDLAEYLVNGNSDLSHKSLTLKPSLPCLNCATTNKVVGKSSKIANKNSKKKSLIKERETKMTSFNNNENTLENKLEKKMSEIEEKLDDTLLKKTFNKRKFASEVKPKKKEKVKVVKEKKKTEIKLHNKNNFISLKENKNVHDQKMTLKEKAKKSRTNDNLHVTKLKSDSTDKSRDDGFYLWDE